MPPSLKATNQTRNSFPPLATFAVRATPRLTPAFPRNGPDPDANWDRENGRIYKIEAEQTRSLAPFDVRQLTSNALVDRLAHPNHWFRDRARCELAKRRDPSVVPRLRAMALQTDDSQLALQGLWSYHVTVGIDDDLASKLLLHPAEYVRYWCVRLLGDTRHVSDRIAKRLSDLAQQETSPVVLSQLAASAKRLSGSAGLELVRNLLVQKRVEQDERIPWLIWWAIESRAISESQPLLEIFGSQEMWGHQAVGDNAGRLVRRYAADGTTAGYDACLALLELIPTDYRPSAHEALRAGLSQRAVSKPTIGQGELFQQQAALDHQNESKADRHYETITPSLRSYIHQLWVDQPNDPLYLELALRTDGDDAYQHLLAQAIHVDRRNIPGLTATLSLLTEFGKSDATPIVLKHFRGAESDAAKLACLSTLGKWGSDEITDELLAEYDSASPAIRSSIVDSLLARSDSALKLLECVDAGTIDPLQIPMDQVRRAAGRKELSGILNSFDYHGEPLQQTLELSRDLPVGDYFKQFPGLQAGDRFNNKGFWEMPIPVSSDVTLHHDDVVIYDDDGYIALKDFLKANGVRHVLLTGYATDMCFCKTTAGYEKLSKDFNVFLVGDATLATFPANATPKYATNAHISFASINQLITQTTWIRFVENR